MSCSLTKMFSKTALLAVLVLIGASLSTSAFASTSSGIDTPSGVTSLPLAVEGVEGMTLYNSNPPTGPVYVGIGTTNPQVALDVNGGVRPGSSTTVTACGAGQANGEGTQRYNYTSHTLEYCNGSSWVTFQQGLPPNSQASYAEPSIGMPCAFTTDSNGVPTATSYYNTPSGWKVENNIYGQSVNQSTYLGDCAPNDCLYTTVCTVSAQGMSYSTFYATSLYNGPSNDQSNYTRIVPWSSN